MAQLGELQSVLDDLAEEGHQLIAVSPDRPSKVAESVKKLGLEFPVLSDAPVAAIEAFGLAYVQTDERYAKLLEEASGLDHHVLPVPAVAVIDEEKVIRFLHADPVYQRRLPAGVLVELVGAWGGEE